MRKKDPVSFKRTRTKGTERHSGLRWSVENDQTLIRLHGTMAVEKIAKKLDRSPSAITQRIFLLRRANKYARRASNQPSDAMLEAMSRTGSKASEVAAMLGMKPATYRYRLQRLGLVHGQNVIRLKRKDADDAG